MELLLLFALVAGAGTALSPCVLPVLPALLSAGATGGRRRPLGIVLGLAATFTVTVAGFARVVDGVGVGDGTLRSLAVVVLLGFGLALLAPRAAARLEAPLSRLARWGPRSRGEGFASGLGVGAALGFVYAPCAGPILAAAITVGAASGAALAVAVAYALGTGHTPEFAFERDAGNVRDAIARSRLRYPVAQDNAYATWTAWGNEYWPAKYLVDAEGRVRYAHFGEGAYEQTEEAIRTLLADERSGDERAARGSGASRLGPRARPRPAEAAGAEATPETYLGADRAERFRPEPPTPGTRTYRGLDGGVLPRSHFSLDGTWRVGAESAEAVRHASISARVVARSVYLVLGSRGARARTVQVLLDGEPLRWVRVRRQRLYRLVALPRTEEHRLKLRVPPGVAGYAFTFG